MKKGFIGRPWSVISFILLLKMDVTDKELVEIYNEFIRCFYQFVSRIFSTNFSQFDKLKMKTNFLLVKKVENENKHLIGPKVIFLSLPVVKEIIINIH